MIKGEDCSFTKHMQIKSRLIIRRNLSRYQSPCPSFFENQKDPFRVSISSFGIWALLSSTYFFGFILYLFHFDFSLFLYPYPLGTAFASIENLFLCMHLYDSIDCIIPAVAIERGKYTEKTVLFNFDYLYISSFLFLDIYFYILVLVSSTISYRSRLCEFFLP